MPPALTGSSGQRPSPPVALIEADIAANDGKINELRQTHRSIHTRPSHEILKFSATLLHLEQKQQDLSLQLSAARLAIQSQEVDRLSADNQLLHQHADARESAPKDTINLIHARDPEDDPVDIVTVNHMSTP